MMIFMTNLINIVAFAARHNGDAKQTADAIRRAMGPASYAALRATLPESVRLECANVDALAAFACAHVLTTKLANERSARITRQAHERADRIAYNISCGMTASDAERLS
jgi:hypothetical protein